MIPIQLDLFKSDHESEIDTLRRNLHDVRVSGDRVRRGTYAEIGTLKKRVNELEERLMILERNICYGK